MSSIGSISGINPAPYVRSSANVQGAEGDYESNAKLFGPVAATAIGAVEATGASAGAVVNFSSESLRKLGDAIESGYDTVADGIGSVIDSVRSGAGSLGSGIANLAHEGAEAVEDAYDDVADALGSVTDSIGDAANAVTDTIGSAVGSIGQYAAVGLAAGKQLINEIV